MLSNEVARYVALNRSLGLKFNNEDQILRSYAIYAQAHGDQHMRADRILPGADRPHRRYERGPFMPPSGAFAFSFTRRTHGTRSHPPEHLVVGVAHARRRTC